MAISLASINARLIRSWMLEPPQVDLELPLWASGTNIKIDFPESDNGKEGDSVAGAVTLALICLLGRRSVPVAAGRVAVSGGMDLRGVLGSVAGIEGKIKGAFDKVRGTRRRRWWWWRSDLLVA